MNKTQNLDISPTTTLQRHPRIGELTQSTKIIFFIILHIPLAFLIRNFQLYATIHAFLTLAVGAFIAITSDDIKKVIPVVAYITGAEVLWRMTRANIFWEIGKYATIAILLIAILKHRKFKKPVFPLIYFLLLLPSLILTIDVFGLGRTTYGAISFNLSGPLATFICIFYFQQIDADIDTLSSWLWWAVYPIISIFTLAASRTLTTPEIQFGTESVFATSGGFGPNQVSVILGLGAMLLIMLAIQEERPGLRNLSILLSIALLAQSVLTFSRGGIVNVLIAVTFAFLHLVGSPSKLMRGLFVIFVIIIVAYFFLFPELDQFTGGAIGVRYGDLSTTGRLEMARADIDLWLKNPLLGVGPGLSGFQRSFMQGVVTHTEYTRILAEHGSLGLISLVILLILLISAYFKAPDAYTRAWIVAFAAWPLVEMAHAAMRLVSISLLLGLALINWDKKDRIDPSGELLKP